VIESGHYWKESGIGELVMTGKNPATLAEHEGE